MKLEFSARADREIERALKWWAEHRPDAPTLLRDELLEYFGRVKQSPNLGEVWGVRRGKTIRRWVLPKTKKKLYVMNEGAEVLRVVSLWGGQRGREPKL